MSSNNSLERNSRMLYICNMSCWRHYSSLSYFELSTYSGRHRIKKRAIKGTMLTTDVALLERYLHKPPLRQCPIDVPSHNVFNMLKTLWYLSRHIPTEYTIIPVSWQHPVWVTEILAQLFANFSRLSKKSGYRKLLQEVTWTKQDNLTHCHCHNWRGKKVLCFRCSAVLEQRQHLYDRWCTTVSCPVYTILPGTNGFPPRHVMYQNGTTDHINTLRITLSQ